MLSFHQFALTENEAEVLQPSSISHAEQQRFAQHNKTLTPAMHKTLGAYKMNSHDKFNGVLRGDLDAKQHKKQYGYYHTPSELKHMDHVTSHEIGEPMHVYRGFRRSDKLNLASLKPGHEFVDHGYGSTSTEPLKAHEFGHLAKVHLPKGTKGHLLPDEHKTYNGENELLLHRGAKYRVMHHGFHKFPGSDVAHPITHLEVVPEKHHVNEAHDVFPQESNKPHEGPLKIKVKQHPKNPDCYMAYHGKKRIGAAMTTKDIEHGKHSIWKSETHPDYRQKGVMRHIYNHIEKTTGKELHPSSTLSDDGHKFWQKFRPEAVKDDLRNHRDKLVGKEVEHSHYGPGKIERVGRKGVLAAKPNGNTYHLSTDHPEVQKHLNEGFGDRGYRQNVGWISPTGKEKRGGSFAYHYNLLPPKLRTNETSMDNYDVPHAAGYTRFSSGPKGSWYDHNASTHGDPKKYDKVLSHIQQHIKDHPHYPWEQKKIELRLTDHNGKDQDSTHEDTDSAIRHLNHLRLGLK